MQKADLIVTETTVITMDNERRILKNSAVVVRDGLIVDIGDSETTLQMYSSENIISGRGKYVFPGFINTHNHTFQVLTKGLGKDRLLWDWLETCVLKAVPHITDEMAYYAAMCSLMENIRSGCTTTLDFLYAHGTPGVFEAVWKAFETVGIRGYVGRTHFFNDYEGKGTQTLESTEEYHKNLRRISSGIKNRELLNMAIVCPALPGIFDKWFYKPDYLKNLRLAADELSIPYTMHIAETKDDDDYITEHKGIRSIPFLKEEQFLGERLVAAHCILMEQEDIEAFSTFNVKVSHNPVSNMILAAGVAPLNEFSKHGITVSIGIDGAGSNDSQDMLETLKFVNLLQKVHNRDIKSLSAEDTLAMATNGGAQALCRTDIGCLVAGNKADFFVFNPDVLKSCPVANPVSSLVYTGSEANIQTVVINGRVILKDGRFVDIDEDHVIKRLNECAAKLRELSGMAD